MNGDECYLLSNTDGSPILPNAIEYNTTYLFQWEGEKKYQYVAQDVSGEINYILHCFFVNKYMNDLEFHEQKLT